MGWRCDLCNRNLDEYEGKIYGEWDEEEQKFADDTLYFCEECFKKELKNKKNVKLILTHGVYCYSEPDKLFRAIAKG